jgi:hypothetical protein
MSRSLILPVIALAVLAGTSQAIAHDPSTARGAWFKSLKQPGSDASCCDISDCRQTEANWRDGQWWAKVAGEWTPVPPSRELDKKSFDGEAYVCANRDFKIIYCFVRPNLAM